MRACGRAAVCMREDSVIYALILKYNLTVKHIYMSSRTRIKASVCGGGIYAGARTHTAPTCHHLLISGDPVGRTQGRLWVAGPRRRVESARDTCHVSSTATSSHIFIYVCTYSYRFRHTNTTRTTRGSPALGLGLAPRAGAGRVVWFSPEMVSLHATTRLTITPTPQSHETRLRLL